ncbi:hypothetical protein FHQ28_00125 [Pasteurellaceae bacterium USgator11]|nr:hypothetical protein FHQ19_02220 [Pasteurellaceae bacterium UScroc12]TNG98488.1 hypothetical protein FHQ24_08555 [Pasteurellaceae bacterium UScroc31]TNG98635.1 hypothetical protein FHQ20_00360 [Pasteurellaceae bacterium USgator41]TNH03346.1 hypothetical protein FHQ28_00125 [Pasteurellaceae bacterium USgator11]
MSSTQDKALEKELLLLKGEVLRRKFNLQTQQTRREIRQPFYYLKTISHPIIRSSLISLSTRILLGRSKWLILPAIGIASFLALKHNSDQTND